MKSTDLQPGDILLSATYWDSRTGRSAEMIIERRADEDDGWIIARHGKYWDHAIDKDLATGTIQAYLSRRF